MSDDPLGPRDPAKAVDLSAKGVEVRRGDYFDLEYLKRAFAGVGELMFVSTVTFLISPPARTFSMPWGEAQLRDRMNRSPVSG